MYKNYQIKINKKLKRKQTVLIWLRINFNVVKSIHMKANINKHSIHTQQEKPGKNHHQ